MFIASEALNAELSSNRSKVFEKGSFGVATNRDHSKEGEKKTSLGVVWGVENEQMSLLFIVFAAWHFWDGRLGWDGRPNCMFYKGWDLGRPSHMWDARLTCPRIVGTAVPTLGRWSRPVLSSFCVLGPREAFLAIFGHWLMSIDVH
ncbi:unnamed protein product [Sphenostylis stenocarpa]|uniref:Uncharacterized protein n=1 Tax=Sphenostylis stenocarpa TaxID=92480 RepID=A0AA86VZV3_9FABA|nr:unnamed protein product [Sphenostylis stenocarpa]